MTARIFFFFCTEYSSGNFTDFFLMNLAKFSTGKSRHNAIKANRTAFTCEDVPLCLTFWIKECFYSYLNTHTRFQSALCLFAISNKKKQCINIIQKRINYYNSINHNTSLCRLSYIQHFTTVCQLKFLIYQAGKHSLSWANYSDWIISWQIYSVCK